MAEMTSVTISRWCWQICEPRHSAAAAHSNA